MLQPSRALAPAAAIGALVPAGAALAGEWEIEVHGGALLQQKVSVPASFGSYTYQSPVTVGPLDPVLSGAAVRWPFGGVAGLRVARRMGRRLTAELDVEYGPQAPDFSKAARADLESTRSAFGAGVVSTGGDEASATLVGRYRFASPAGDPGAPFEEMDTVTGLATFEGSGALTQVNVTLGVFLRF